MEFVCQKHALEELKFLAEKEAHSLLVEGISGCGKTYVCNQYAKMINADEVVSVQPSVADIRELIDECIMLKSKIAIIIENLDTGVVNASHALLKFLEEPKSNIYILITVRNMYSVPDTIRSRSHLVSLQCPTDEDLKVYTRNVYPAAADRIIDSANWEMMRTFKDIQVFHSLLHDHSDYLNNLPTLFQFKDPVSSCVWKMQKFDDGSDTPLEFVIRFLMQFNKTNRYIQRACMDCLRELELRRISKQGVLSKLVLECKYGG